MKMTLSNACGFIGAGLMMEALAFLPGMVPRRELWLMVMGCVLMLAGGSFLVRTAWVWVVPRIVYPLSALRVRQAEERGRRLPGGSRAMV